MRNRRRLTGVWALAAATSLVFATTALAAGTTIYSTMPQPVPGNVVSLGYEATATAEFGDQVTFASGPRQLREITVLMSSWGCQSGHWNTNNCLTTPGATFNHALTVNVYAVGSGGSVGAPLATKTQTFNIPFRPSADPDCAGGRWEAAPGQCFSGLAAPVTFDLASLNVTLPNSAIVSIAYNTTHYGAAPMGEAQPCFSTPAGCGYDSLNVGLVDPASTQSVGSNPAPNDAYWNTQVAGWYCDGGTGGSGTFRLDAAQGSCSWTGYKPALTITASFPTATTAAGCKKDGWQSLSRANGTNFKNQGDCIQYVNTGK